MVAPSKEGAQQKRQNKFDEGSKERNVLTEFLENEIVM